MNRFRWILTIAIGVAPALCGLQLHVLADSARPQVAGPQAKVTNPHGPIAIPCQNCHTAVNWKPIRSNPEFNHDQTAYPLRGMHAKVACTQCHTNLVFKKVSTQCAECHADIHRRQFGANCESCHSVKGWQVAVKDIQNHQNRFPLVGAHALVECDQCHKNAAAGQFVGLSTSCYSCHQKDFLTPVINHVALNFPTTCETCHTMNNFVSAKFDHLKFTGYALTGAHATLECTACHINNVFTGTPAQCYACHTPEYVNSTNPPHVKLGLPTTCGTCHNTTNWNNATFDHALYAHYPLTGKHATVPCLQCHTDNNYSSTPTDCYACHKGDFTGTTNPNHVTAAFPTNCALCHTTAGWTPSTFNHNTTKFPLTGFHATMPCAQCHTTATSYSGSLPTACYGCHQADFAGANNPPHVSGNFPTDCSQCHNTTNWNGATFNHNNTKFPLTGAHITVACALCHKSNNYAGTLPLTCIGCHQTDFNGAMSPPHVSGGFPTDCTQCHNTTSWTSATFNHNNTGFPLTGFHATMQCATCHTDNYKGTLPTTCDGCHDKDYLATTNPVHKTAGFPTTCETCHNTTSWLNATFDHNKTPFPLTGFHVNVPCASCHTTSNFAAAPTTCDGCHDKDYLATTSPAHKAAGFPTTCETCHSTASWLGATFNHNSTPFPLTGFHASMQCAQCHTTAAQYLPGSLPTTCDGCHHPLYVSTTNPAHATAGFPTTCETCHSTTNWTSATFNHNNTPFPLTGFHATMACATCHTSAALYAPGSLPMTCDGCHHPLYVSTTNPAHATAGFPTACETCHSTTNWTSATFNHASTGFTLTGFHATMQCAQCHTTAAQYVAGSLPMTCDGCHHPLYVSTTSPAHVAAGFPTTCDTCHTTTAWTGAVFNHNNTPFPLTGFHATSVTCVQCHINNVFVGTPTVCSGCHLATYNATTNPNHTSAGWPNTCDTCHTTTAWLPATLPTAYHTLFPVTHGNANGVCTTCHANSANYAVFSCTTSCHGSGNAANFNHPNVNGYTYTPTSCYACHKSGGGG